MIQIIGFLICAAPKVAEPAPYAPPLTQEQIECIEKNAGNTEAVLAC